MPPDAIGYGTTMPTEQSEEILAVLKQSAAALRNEGVEFALGGALAAWARGGPPTEHDVDLEASCFYTDSYNDLPMLERVGRPVAVNPDMRLGRHARRRGWAIESWW